MSKQSASTMGQTYVGLYDENEHCVMLIYWGDSWVGSQKGYFNIGFYPQNGGAYYQQSGYIYTSFCKTGKVWWTSYPGGQGGIMTSIDGAGDAYPIGECDNASRVIKYVAMWGGRYSSYNLVQMKIHDINVVCDLNEHDPNAPSVPPPTQDPLPGGNSPHVKNDGTTASIADSVLQQASSVFASAAEFLTAYWTGWWPLLHLMISSASSPLCSISLHVTVDLLGSFEVVSVGSNYFGLQSMSVAAQEAAEDGAVSTVASIWDDPMTWLITAVAVSTLGLILGTLAYQFAGLWQPWLVALAIWTGACLSYVIYVYERFLEMGLTGEDAGFKYLLVILSSLGLAAGSLGTLWSIGCRSLGRMYQYWTQVRYFNKSIDKGNKGRSASGNLLASLTILGVTVILSLIIATSGH